MNTVMLTTLARLPPARFRIWSTCENTCFTCASKLLAMSAPWLSRVAVWPATQTMRPPSVTTPGENARDSWNGVFSMYSAAVAAKGGQRIAASRTFRSMVISMEGLLLQQSFEPAVRVEPDGRHHGVQSAGGQRRKERQGNRHEIDHQRNVALEVTAQGLRQQRIAAVRAQQHPREDGVRHGGADQHYAIGGDGDRRKVVLGHPAGSERHQREPEQKMHVRPKRGAVHVVHRVEHVMVVGPVDGDEYKAHNVGEEHRQEGQQRLRVGVVRHLQLQHHDGDDYGDYAVAESFQPSLPHYDALSPAAHANCARSRRMPSTSFSSCGPPQSAAHLRLQPKFFSVARIGPPYENFHQTQPAAAAGSAKMRRKIGSSSITV